MRANETDKTRAIIIDRLKLTADSGREAKDAFVAKLGSNNLASTLPDAGLALMAEAKSRWCWAVLNRLSREPMLLVLQDEVELLRVRIKVLGGYKDLAPMRQYTRTWSYEAYLDLHELLTGFYLPRLEAVMAAENIADSPWRD